MKFPGASRRGQRDYTRGADVLEDEPPEEEEEEDLAPPPRPPHASTFASIMGQAREPPTPTPALGSWPPMQRVDPRHTAPPRPQTTGFSSSGADPRQHAGYGGDSYRPGYASGSGNRYTTGVGNTYGSGSGHTYGSCSGGSYPTRRDDGGKGGYSAGGNPRYPPADPNDEEIKTSLSMCDGNHMRFGIYWRLRDPWNNRGAWRVRVADYRDDIRDGWRWHDQERPRLQHVHVEGLAERMVRDLRDFHGENWERADIPSHWQMERLLWPHAARVLPRDEDRHRDVLRNAGGSRTAVSQTEPAPRKTKEQRDAEDLARLTKLSEDKRRRKAQDEENVRKAAERRDEVQRAANDVYRKRQEEERSAKEAELAAKQRNQASSELKKNKGKVKTGMTAEERKALANISAAGRAEAELEAQKEEEARQQESEQIEDPEVAGEPEEPEDLQSPGLKKRARRVIDDSSDSNESPSPPESPPPVAKKAPAVVKKMALKEYMAARAAKAAASGTETSKSGGESGETTEEIENTGAGEVKEDTGEPSKPKKVIVERESEVPAAPPSEEPERKGIVAEETAVTPTGQNETSNTTNVEATVAVDTHEQGGSAVSVEATASTTVIEQSSGSSEVIAEDSTHAEPTTVKDASPSPPRSTPSSPGKRKHSEDGDSSSDSSSSSSPKRRKPTPPASPDDKEGAATTAKAPEGRASRYAASDASSTTSSSSRKRRMTWTEEDGEVTISPGGTKKVKRVRFEEPASSPAPTPESGVVKGAGASPVEGVEETQSTDEVDGVDVVTPSGDDEHDFDYLFEESPIGSPSSTRKSPSPERKSPSPARKSLSSNDEDSDRNFLFDSSTGGSPS